MRWVGELTSGRLVGHLDDLGWAASLFCNLQHGGLDLLLDVQTLQLTTMSHSILEFVVLCNK